MTDSDKGRPQPAAPEEPADLLSLWRSCLSHEVPQELANRVSAALIARGGAAEPSASREADLLRAEAGDATAWLHLADGLPFAMPLGDDGDVPVEDMDDLEGSCLWMATRWRSRWARLMLVIKMAACGCQQALVQGYAEFIALGSYIPTKTLALLRALGPIEEHLQELKRARAGAEPQWMAEAAPPAALAPLLPGGSMRVPAAAPVASANKGDKALVEPYAPLASQIALRPMPDPDDLAAQLLAEALWFANLIESIRDDLALARRLSRRHFHLPPLLLHGRSGFGKTRFVQRLAEVLEVSLARVLGAGASDSRLLSGTARGWGTTMPCLPLVVMRQHSVANPLILVDEIDKAGTGDHNGRLVDVLTAMTDPSIARRWPDECLLTEADLSQVTWILLCNHPHRVPPMLRARCRVIHLGRPRPCDFDVILQGAMRDLAAEFGAEPAALPDLPEETVAALRRGFVPGRLQPRQLAGLARGVLAAEGQGEQLMT
jgi:hypothetical protein